MTDAAPFEIAALPTELVDIDSIQPHPDNPHKGDVDGIADSLGTFGQWRQIVVQRSSGNILAGNSTWKGAKKQGASRINVTWADVDDVTAKKIMLADNQWGRRGADDEDAVARIMRELWESDQWTEAIGYTSEDLDRMLATMAASDAGADDTPEVPAARDLYVSPGDVWTVGKHRIACGDSRDALLLDRLLGGAEAGMIWTDPPYGVEYVGVSRERDPIANDGTDPEALRALLTASIGSAVERLRPGRAVYVAGPGGAQSAVFVGVLVALGVYRQTIIWVKDQLVLGRSDYQWRHEHINLGVKRGRFDVKASSPLHYGWRPGAAHWFVSDRSLDTVWEIPRPKKSAEHPTMKPVELVERCILASSKRKDVILDPFLGSGSTIVAAARTGRVGYGIELDPGYAQVSIERVMAQTGERATRL